MLALHQGWAYNLAYRVLGQDADARDAVQDAFLLTVRALRGQGTPPRTVDGFKPWLRRVVSNAALTQIRRRHGVHAVSVEAVEDSLAGPSNVEPGHAVDRDETRSQVLQVLLGLPETQRVALALREYLDASYDEIAETLDLPRTAIGTLLFRARAAFRSSYDRVTETAPSVDCPDLVPLFGGIIDGEARPDHWVALEDHLRGCQACSGELEGQRRARRLYALVPLLALPAGWEPFRSAVNGAIAGASAGASAGQVGTPVTPTAGQAPMPLTPDAVGPVSTSMPSVTSPPIEPSGALTSAAAGGAPAVASGGLASGGGAAGIVATISSAKLTVAALAAATLIGVGVAATPFGQQALVPVASPSPAAAVVVSPSPEAGALPGVAASPAGTAVVVGVVSPSTGASPSPDASLATRPVVLSPEPATPSPLASPRAVP